MSGTIRKFMWLVWMWISCYYMVRSLSLPNFYANFRNFRRGPVGGMVIAGTVSAFVQFKTNKEGNKDKTALLNMNRDEDDNSSLLNAGDSAGDTAENHSLYQREAASFISPNDSRENETTVEETIEVIANGSSDLLTVEQEHSHQSAGVTNEDMLHTKDEMLSYLSTKHDDIIKQGWSLVHLYPQFSLYKRHKQPRPHLTSSQQLQPAVSNHTIFPSLTPSTSAMEYLMIGEYANISPYSFFVAQMNYHYRKVWDNSMRDMSIGKINILKYPLTTELQQPQRKYVDEERRSNQAISEEQQTIDTPTISQDECVDLSGLTNGTGYLSTPHDMLYYRTKIPWPLKDRDYSLSRRCEILDKDNAIVLASRAQEAKQYPPIKNVVRVDKYWCNSAFVSTHPTTTRTTTKTITTTTTTTTKSIPQPAYVEEDWRNSPDTPREEEEERSLDDYDDACSATKHEQPVITTTTTTSPCTKNLLQPSPHSAANTPSSSVIDSIDISRRNGPTPPATSTMHHFLSSSLVLPSTNPLFPFVEDTATATTATPISDHRRMKRPSFFFKIFQQKHHLPVYKLKEKMSKVFSEAENMLLFDESKLRMKKEKIVQFLVDCVDSQEEKEEQAKEVAISENTLSGGGGALKSVNLAPLSPLMAEQIKKEDTWRSHTNSVFTNEEIDASSSSSSVSTRMFPTPSPPFSTSTTDPYHMKTRTHIQRHKKIEYMNTLFAPGVKFVTMFCDESQVPLPKTVIDMIAHQAEKLVPDSAQRLYNMAKQIQEQGVNEAFLTTNSK